MIVVKAEYLVSLFTDSTYTALSGKNTFELFECDAITSPEVIVLALPLLLIGG
jgi:hypothetical protein